VFSPRFVPVVLKQVVRHRTRSILTVGGVAVAQFLFLGVEALRSGADAVTRASADETTLVVYRKDRYCPLTSQMPESYAPRLARVPGVAGVVPIRIVVNNCRTSLDVVTFRGVPEEGFIEEFAPGLEITTGTLDEWRRRSDAVLLGETLARRRGLSVGDRFDAAGITVSVAGILRSDRPEHQNVAYAHLGFLQQASGARYGGYVTQFNVRVSDPARLDDVAHAIDAEFAADPEPTHTRSETAFVARAAADVLEIVGFTRWLAWGCLVAVLALVGNALVLAVQDRIREYAILQTLGYDTPLLARLIVAEGVVLSVIGGALGAAAATALLAWGQFSVSAEGVSIAVAAGPGLMLRGLLLAMALGVAAGLLPAWQASRREIVECFRAV
jgi:putative ABC transport system permease protein